MKRMRAVVAAAAVLVAAMACLPADQGKPQREPMSTLGKVKVGDYEGQVWFQYPQDDGERYRVDVLVSKNVNTPPIKAEAEVWLLARVGKAVAQAKDSTTETRRHGEKR